MIIKSKFKFNPIGQGGFYTGKIKNSLRYEEFNFVYDCGSSSTREILKKSIDDFKTNLPKGKIDVLFISHLDDDHVNGINYLLTDVVCDKVYLPYLTPIERLCVAIKHKPSETIDYPEYLKFLQSPHDYLLEFKGVGEVIYINGNSEGNQGSNNNLKPDNPDNLQFLLKDNLDDLNEQNSEFKEWSSNKKNKLKFKKGNKLLTLNFIWEFFLYHEPADESCIDLFKKKLNEIFDILVLDDMSAEELKLILSRNSELRLLRKKFRELFKSLNKTGILVQHKPNGYKDACFLRCLSSQENTFFYNLFGTYRHSIYTRSLYTWDPVGFVTLLTGDISQDQIANSTYISQHFNQLAVFQIPHHGSEIGWKDKYLKDLNSNGITSAIINFGYGNTYGHPKPKVLEDLMNNKFYINLCNQFEEFSYQIKIYI